MAAANADSLSLEDVTLSHVPAAAAAATFFFRHDGLLLLTLSLQQPKQTSARSGFHFWTAHLTQPGTPPPHTHLLLFSVTRLGDWKDFGQLFKAFGNN